MDLTKRVLQVDAKGTRLRIEFDFGEDEPTLFEATRQAGIYLLAHYRTPPPEQTQFDFGPESSEDD